jgi:hypothetical protein
MSLLNTTNDGLPNVLAALCGVLVLEKGTIAEADLLARAAPENIVQDEGKMVRQTLNRWVELGLLVRDEGKVSFSSHFPPAAKISRDDIAGVVRRAVCRCALAPENNPQLWAKESAKAADLTRSLCLLLAQDVYRTGFNQLEALENRQVVNAELRLIQNSTRINGLKKWAHFLGFVRQPDGLDIDPTVAVRESIGEWMAHGQTMPANAFLDRLAGALPVLDGGLYRTAVEEILDRQTMFVPEAGQVSSSLSRALLALRASGELHFETKSDAVGEGMTLSGRDGVRPDLRFTHVTRAEKPA